LDISDKEVWVFGIVQRSIMSELVKVFGLSLIGITGLIVLATIVQEASQRGLPPAQIFAAIPLIVPSMLPFIIPPTTLFAACVVFGRLAHDNEITAIKSAGINIMHVVWPGILLGAMMSGCMFGMFYYLIPHCHHILRSAVVNDAEEYIFAVLKRDHEVRRLDFKLNWEIWVEQIHGHELRNAIFKRRDAKGHYDVIARAREAELHVDVAKREMLVQMRHGEVLDEAGKTRVHFEEKDYSVPLPELDKSRKPSTREMTWNELRENRREAVEELAGLAMDIGRVETLPNPANLTPDQYRAFLQYKQGQQQLRWRALNVEMQMRPALSCGCLFFVLVGCPIGIWFSRSDYLSAFISCFLPIVFIYYPIQLCFTNLAKDGRVDPAVAHWIANGFLGLIAIGLFRKLLKN
jgi:lipopolysaccharide export system permease protein